MLGYIGSPFPDRPSTMPRWFDATGTATQSIFRRFHGGGVPASLYHYTTTAALISIIEKNAFWLSDATYLNDRSEIKYGAACALDRLRAARREEADETVATMLALAIKTLESKPHPPVYICCFSWEADDLGQWRGYGKGGTPVSIELENTPTMFGRSEGMFSEVRYDAGEQSWIFDEIITAYRQAYAADILEPRFERRTKPLTRDEENAFCADKLHVDLWRYIVSCKSPVFRPEREVRFIYIAHRLDASWFPGHPKEMFRESDGRIIPHLSSRHLEIAGYERNDEIPRLPIRSVWVGPADGQAIIARGVRRLLDGNGYDKVEVVQSSTPFRG